MSKEHEFAIYAGDDFVASGTARELAVKFGVTADYIHYLSTPTHQRKLARSKKPTGRAKYAIKLGLPDELEEGA